MMRAQVEPYHDVLGELLPLYPLHHAEVHPDSHRPECRLAMRYDVYDALAERDELALVTLRDARGALVGYCLCFVVPGMHTAHCLHGLTNLFYVHPLARGHHGGMRLIRTMRRALEARGVQRWVAGEIVGRSSGLGRLLELCGFHAEEVAYSIWLGD